MSGRKSIVTGGAAGIGAATAALLRERGDEVVTVDLRDADVIADLETAAGRATMVESTRNAFGGSVDVVVANAGTIGRGPADVRLNFFGAVATLEGLRPLLAEGAAPRAVTLASFALVQAVDDALVGACLAGDENAAAARAADVDPLVVYASAKRALARWVRAQAPSGAWGGAGIALNAVGPGIVRTGMTQALLDDPGMADLLTAAVPMPFGGVVGPGAVATAIGFLTAATTVGITGQVLFVDGGAECVVRGDDVW